MDANGSHLRGRDPGREEVDSSANMLWHAQRSRERVNRASRMREQRKLGDFQCLADHQNIICKLLGKNPMPDTGLMTYQAN